jgi:outer membrane protein OmpA-like peptidoglycan-associated protein
VKERVALEEVLVPHEIERLKVCRMETVCKLRYVDGHAKRARVQNLIAPLHYDEETVDVSQDFIGQVQQALENLGDKQNVAVHFVGYTDDRPLTERNERIYATHVGISKARARRVALAIQDSLGIPTTAIQSDGRGTSRPVASNETEHGRALNRRVEVEFWYDDPLQELPDEPQLCPESAGAELVTRVYDPPWGRIEPIAFNDGQPVLPPGLKDDVSRAMADVADKTNPRVRFVGYTRNERLERRTALVYGDDIGSGYAA